MANVFDIMQGTAHAVCESSLLKATTDGHIYSLKCDADYDNGSIVCVGDWVEGQVFKTKTYVAGEHPVLILSAPTGYHTESKYMTEEKYFYNKAGEIARGYELYVGDIFTLSADGFTGTPAVGKFVNASMTVADTAGTSGVVGEIVEKVTYTNDTRYRVVIRSIGV